MGGIYLYNNNINGYNYYPQSLTKVKREILIIFSNPVRPVTLDEVRFYWCIFYFPDLQTCIYTKQINKMVRIKGIKQIINNNKINSYVTRKNLKC